MSRDRLYRYKLGTFCYSVVRNSALLVLQLVKYGFVIFFNVTMWGCYVNSLKALPSLQATVTNFATNFLSSGLAGFFLFGEPLSSRVKYK